jgi:hypothetical protein
MSQIQAGGAAVVITASDQTATGVQSAAKGFERLQQRMDATSKSSSNLETVAGKIQKRFAGMAVTTALVNTAFRSFADAFEKSLKDPSQDFFNNFANGFAEAFQSLPVVGAIAKLGDLVVQSITGSLQEAAELAAFESDVERKRKIGMQGASATDALFGQAQASREQLQRRQEDREIATLGRQVQVNRQPDMERLGARLDAALRRQEEIAEQRGRERFAEARSRIEDQARAAGVLEVSTGALDSKTGQEVFRRNPAVDQAIEAQRRLIQDQVRQEIEEFGVGL